MDDSILKKLAPELRIAIYPHVFEGARITINIHVSKHGTDQRPSFKFRYSHHAHLTKTCRTIRNETLPILFGKAFVVAKGPDGYAWMDDLNKVIKDDLAAQITHIRNVRLPKLRELSSHNHADATTLVKKYPKLKLCEIWLDTDDKAGLVLSVATASSILNTAKFEDLFQSSRLGKKEIKLRHILPVLSGLIVAPKGVLTDSFGIREPCVPNFIQTQTVLLKFLYVIPDFNGPGICRPVSTVRKISLRWFDSFFVD